jgi:hypothetical protein
MFSGFCLFVQFLIGAPALFVISTEKHFIKAVLIAMNLSFSFPLRGFLRSILRGVLRDVLPSFL